MDRTRGHRSATPAQGADTVLTGRLDRSVLYGVLSDMESLGLELVEVRQQTPGRGRAP